MTAELPLTDADKLVEHWTSRETQLNQLHEEIVTQREALLRSTELYRSAQEARGVDSLDTLNRLSNQRNASLLQHIDEAQQSLEDATHTSSQGNRFATLQANYWSMVRSILPVWEEELLEYKERLKVKREGRQGVTGPS